MKKIYQIPTTDVVEMNATTMLAVSGFNENLDERGGDAEEALVKDPFDSSFIWDEE